MTPPDPRTERRSPFVTSGVDVVDISRIARLLEEFGDSFRERAFTPAERAYCESRPDPAQHYAARWAAKEAFRKAVGTAGPTVPFDAVGVDRGDGADRPDSADSADSLDSVQRDEPNSRTDGPVLDLAERAETALGYTLDRANVSRERAATSVSLSHDRSAGVAVAHVLVVGEREPHHQEKEENGEAGSR